MNRNRYNFYYRCALNKHQNHKRSLFHQYSIKPDIERVNDVMMGVVAIKMTEPLSQGEIDDLKDYITGQFSDGWGESFEQQAIQVDGNQIYVHFWNSEEYFIKTEEEMATEQEQEFEMEGMQGIQGMSGMSGM